MRSSRILSILIVVVPLGCSSDHTLAVSSALTEDLGGESELQGGDTDTYVPTPPRQCEGDVQTVVGYGAALMCSDDPLLECGTMHEQFGSPCDKVQVDCTRSDSTEDWVCACSENDVEVMTATVAADAPMDEKGALGACGWSPEFMSCFYSGHTIAQCRSE